MRRQSKRTVTVPRAFHTAQGAVPFPRGRTAPRRTPLFAASGSALIRCA